MLKALLLLTPILGFSMTGKFSGKGIARYASGREYQCSEIFLSLKQTTNRFYLNEGGYICGLLQAGFDNFKMDIRNGELFHQDQKLGVITDQEIKYSIYDPEDNSTYFFAFTKLDEKRFHYFEEWHDGEKIALKIEGTLLEHSPKSPTEENHQQSDVQ